MFPVGPLPDNPCNGDLHCLTCENAASDQDCHQIGTMQKCPAPDVR